MWFWKITDKNTKKNTEKCWVYPLFGQKNWLPIKNRYYRYQWQPCLFTFYFFVEQCHEGKVQVDEWTPQAFLRWPDLCLPLPVLPFFYLLTLLNSAWRAQPWLSATCLPGEDYCLCVIQADGGYNFKGRTNWYVAKISIIGHCWNFELLNFCCLNFWMTDEFCNASATRSSGA